MKNALLLPGLLAMVLLAASGAAQAPGAGSVQEGREQSGGDELSRLSVLVEQAVALELSRLDRLLPTLFPDTRNRELIRLKTGFEKNFFLPPRIERVQFIEPAAGNTPGSDDTSCRRFERIDIHLDGRTLVKKLHFTRALITFRQPNLETAALQAGKLIPREPVEVRVFLEAPFDELAAFIVRECRRNGATVPDLYLENDTIRARGRLRVLWFNLDLEAKGTIYLDVPDRAVRFRARRVAIGRFALPRFMYRSLVNEFNPVFRFEPLVFGLKPTVLRFEDGASHLELTGSVSTDEQSDRFAGSE